MMIDSVPVPFLRHQGQAPLRDVCSSWASSSLRYKLLTLLKVVAWQQPAILALLTDHPVALLIADCVMAADERDQWERAQVKMTLKTGFNLAIVGRQDDSNAF